MSRTLSAIVDGRLMGRITRQQDRLVFRYDGQWRSSPQGYPLSLSMPLLLEEHPHQVIEAFLWGLLPDNEAVLNQWGKLFQVSPRNPYELVGKIGEDCAGAVQFISSEREESFLASGPVLPKVTWLKQTELEDRIQLLLRDHSATRTARDHGHFSLAGAQPKTAFYHDPIKNRWGVPEGRTPTTHIFKPATGAFDGYVENEHFCLRLASALGMQTATSFVMQVAGHPVIVIERYDRMRVEKQTMRIHQEDFCQALAVRPQIKYQNQGGPSVKAITDVIRDHSSAAEQDIQRFAEALIFNWLISGTDAHAKNFSVLLAGGSQVRLAPLYDMASSLPYPQQVNPRKAKLAMMIGSKYHVKEIGRSQWEGCARELRMPFKAIEGIMESTMEKISAQAFLVAEQLVKEGLGHDVMDMLPGAIDKCVRLDRAKILGAN
jgi:serine/threonine-protein kinase HipA